MLVAAALALLILVVASIGALLALDLGRTDHRHWLDALKSWQQLVGSVLGFLGAAGVLVLSTAISQDNDVRRSADAAHAIGLGLAYEVQTMGIGLRTAKQIGDATDYADPNIGSTCVSYGLTLQQLLVPSTPVYNAVLPRMVDFGDNNLQLFVSFYALYSGILRETPDIVANDCKAAPADWMRYMVGQVGHMIDFYTLISRAYGIAGAGITAQADASSAQGSQPSSAGG